MQQKVLSGTVVLKLECASESLGKFVQTQFLDPTPECLIQLILLSVL